MRSYVIGAGVSYTAGYPLGADLLPEIERFISQMGNFGHRWDYGRDWPLLVDWLSTNKNPLIAEAHRTRKIEHLFTALDLASMLSQENLDSVARFLYETPEAGEKASEAYHDFEATTESYQKYRKMLLFALELYFNHKHQHDHCRPSVEAWDELEALAGKTSTGDVVITFNYDATLERVLWRRGKWAPSDGYGFHLVFQQSEFDSKPVTFPASAVTVLHLHGATGWYPKPVWRPGYDPSGANGPFPREALSPAPLETDVSLDPIFLRGLLGTDALTPRCPRPHRPKTKFLSTPVSSKTTNKRAPTVPSSPVFGRSLRPRSERQMRQW